MPLVLTLKRPPDIPIEVDAVRADRLRGRSRDDVCAIRVRQGNQAVELGELFAVRGSAGEDGHVVWSGDCSQVKLIGAGMESGRVTVEGSAGMHLGAGMTSGEIVVEGSAGDWAGAELQGGRILIRGDAGNCLGAVYRGGRRGMTGGEILVGGNAGHEVGHTMRRGLIAVGGSVGDAAGYNLLAGSIVVLGGAGVRPGAGMRRGTIALLGASGIPALLPTFRPAGICEALFLRILLVHLTRRGFEVPEALMSAPFHRFNGDFLELGKGEILVRRAA